MESCDLFTDVFQVSYGGGGAIVWWPNDNDVLKDVQTRPISNQKKTPRSVNNAHFSHSTQMKLISYAFESHMYQ